MRYDLIGLGYDRARGYYESEDIKALRLIVHGDKTWKKEHRNLHEFCTRIKKTSWESKTKTNIYWKLTIKEATLEFEVYRAWLQQRNIDPNNSYSAVEKIQKVLKRTLRADVLPILRFLPRLEDKDLEQRIALAQAQFFKTSLSDVLTGRTTLDRTRIEQSLLGMCRAIQQHLI